MLTATPCHGITPPHPPVKAREVAVMVINILFLVGGVALGHYVPWLWTWVIAKASDISKDAGF